MALHASHGVVEKTLWFLPIHTQVDVSQMATEHWFFFHQRCFVPLVSDGQRRLHPCDPTTDDKCMADDRVLQMMDG